MLKKILFFIILLLFIFTSNVNAVATTDLGDSAILNALLSSDGDNIASAIDDTDGFTVLENFLFWIKTELTSLLQIIAIAAFLFLGVKLSFARGKPEEFKKALMHLVYTIVGIFIVSIAWALVSLVSTINF